MGYIAELNGQLDYERFFTEGIPTGLTDAEWRKAIGNRVWELYHGVIDHYPCETCKSDGQILVSGIHDMTNLGTGKGVFDPEKFRRFLKLVEEMKRKYHEGGHCTGATCKPKAAAAHRTGDA